MDKTKPTENIFDHINPLQAIDLAIQGIEQFKGRNDFRFEMSTFGRFDGGICYGCLATACTFTIVEEEPNEFNIGYEEHPHNGYTKESLLYFEDAIDSLRAGMLQHFMVTFIAKKDTNPAREQAYNRLNFVKEFLELDSEWSRIHLTGSPSDVEFDQFIEDITDLKSKLEPLSYIWEEELKVEG